jgi:flagellar motility protein MotE (MotC chaperone)
MEDIEDSNFQEEPPEPTDAGMDADSSDKPKKNYLLYGIALLWSFFLVFIFMYFLMYRHQRSDMQNSMANNLAVQDSVAMDSVAVNDTTKSAPVDSVTQNVEKDTVKQSAKPSPSEGFLTVDDEMKILQLENGRRKREIDYLWNELRTLKKQSQDMAEKADKVDSAVVVAPAPVAAPDTTPSFAELRQQQLKKEQEEKDRLAAIKAEQERKEQILATNAKLYSSMTPKQAAMILNEFDDATVASMLKQLRERQAAKILKEMNQAKAIQICKLMAK